MYITKINTTKIKNKDLAKKIFGLIVAAILMGFAQSILNYTSPIGMAPVDSVTKGMESATPEWITYSRFNYVTVTALVFVAIWASPKDKKLITSSALITGYTLAFLVTMLTNHVVNNFPGFELDPNNNAAKLIHHEIYKDFTILPWIWFIVGFVFLTLSIGIWVNVGFAIRPYDIMLIRLANHSKKHGYVWKRNVSDFSLVIISILLSTIGFLFKTHEGYNYFNYLTVGPGTILFVVGAGYVSNFWIKIFEKII